MQRIILYSFLLLLFLTKLSLATVINKIEVNGNSRISNETVIVFGDIKLNTDINDNELDLILRKLYETNFFENINLSINNKTLIITLIENPLIQNVSIVGVPNKKIREKILEIIFADSQAKPRAGPCPRLDKPWENWFPAPLQYTALNVLVVIQ